MKLLYYFPHVYLLDKCRAWTCWWLPSWGNAFWSLHWWRTATWPGILFPLKMWVVIKYESYYRGIFQGRKLFAEIWYTRVRNVCPGWPFYGVKCLCSRGWEWGREESHSHKHLNIWFLWYIDLVIWIWSLYLYLLHN